MPLSETLKHKKRMPQPDEENIKRTVFVAWERHSNNGNHHAYVYTQIEGYKTTTQRPLKYLFGLEVSKENQPISNTLEFMQRATSNTNPFPDLCDKCRQELERKGLF